MSLLFREALAKAEGKPAALRRLSNLARERAYDAKLMGWEALEKSWEADLRKTIEALRRAEPRIY